MKKFKIIIIPVILITTIIIISCHYNTYKGLPSDHFDGSRFYHNDSSNSLKSIIKMLWTMNPPEWPEWINDPPQPTPPKRVENGRLRVTFINHATVLLQLDSLNILTDPIWSKRSSPVSWVGPKRVRNPGVAIEDLPVIDIILISHNHYDHLDLPTLRKLTKKHNPKILVGLGVKKLLESEGFNNVVEMDWWHEFNFNNSTTKITFVPSRHASGRGICDKDKTLWGGFVVEGNSGRIYFAGDTGYGSFLKEINKRFDDFRLAILPIGAYEPRWFMEKEHMNPEDAVRAHQLLNVQQSLGMHFGTFSGHTDETINQHEKDLLKALIKHNIEISKFWVLKFGEGRDVP